MQKLKGFKKLYFSHILSDFQSAVNKLKETKMSLSKNIELAQEVYGAFSAISQYYSSFDADRVKRCEYLLDRVVKAESFEENYKNAAEALSPETLAAI